MYSALAPGGPAPLPIRCRGRMRGGGKMPRIRSMYAETGQGTTYYWKAFSGADAAMTISAVGRRKIAIKTDVPYM